MKTKIYSTFETNLINLGLAMKEYEVAYAEWAAAGKPDKGRLPKRVDTTSIVYEKLRNTMMTSVKKLAKEVTE